ncbi:hypothetical protein DUI87_05628 [Hirundo rustica rustica]|uniref:Uncharacterized protein n=1 Tax=Hirundo rustica rustica TaxID=333673 RepID=A0A3M0KV82_HIRRU|nr:hypothetical protein DUI87_05628 [Hirundo rustica rustica]
MSEDNGQEELKVTQVSIGARNEREGAENLQVTAWLSLLLLLSCSKGLPGKFQHGTTAEEHQGQEQQRGGKAIPANPWDSCATPQNGMGMSLQRGRSSIPGKGFQRGFMTRRGEGDSAPLPCSGETPPAELPPALGPTAGGCGAAGESPEESTEMLQELEPLCSGARLGELGVLTWRGEGSRETSEPLPGPKEAPGELERGLGQGMEGQDTGNGFKLEKGKFRWDIGKKSSPVRVERPWHKVPGEAVAVPGFLASPRPGWMGSNLG